MKQNNDLGATLETSRLLSELDLAIGESSVMRDIVNRYERVRDIEKLTGPSRLTRIMRKEIRILESRLRLERLRQQKPDAAFSPV